MVQRHQSSMKYKLRLVCGCETYSDVLYRLVEAVELSPGHRAGIEVSQLRGDGAEVVVHSLQILQEHDDAAVARCIVQTYTTTGFDPPAYICAAFAVTCD